jgi:hypothetical protein
MSAKHSAADGTHDFAQQDNYIDALSYQILHLAQDNDTFGEAVNVPIPHLDSSHDVSACPMTIKT